FEHLLKGKSVLEIGAGCGAISRYLGEAGAEVLALEGSPRRAAIAASRTRDLDNVTVLSERFDDFNIDQQFDVITLVGVLEYASMFSADADPAYGMLNRVRKLLKPDGHLFIAIENQLGLKYFAGAPEDHLGIAMY
uniref:class I SAM-dependent methyltransferase n=1 Tax=Pseudomonas viridiflava TaxID=33069 RepID=UPI0013D6EEFD